LSLAGFQRSPVGQVPLKDIPELLPSAQTASVSRDATLTFDGCPPDRKSNCSSPGSDAMDEDNDCGNDTMLMNVSSVEPSEDIDMRDGGDKVFCLFSLHLADSNIGFQDETVDYLQNSDHDKPLENLKEVDPTPPQDIVDDEDDKDDQEHEECEDEKEKDEQTQPLDSDNKEDEDDDKECEPSEKGSMRGFHRSICSWTRTSSLTKSSMNHVLALKISFDGQAISRKLICAFDTSFLIFQSFMRPGVPHFVYGPEHMLCQSVDLHPSCLQIQ
jgi:hypothetical protein